MHKLMPSSPSFPAIFLVMLAVFLGACASTPDEGFDYSKWSVEKLYAEGKDALNDGNYQRAIKLYESLESGYPFGPYAEQAQLDMAYAYMKSDEPDTAIASADRFIKLHPRHTNVDYAYYLRGLARFSEKESLATKYLPISKRDKAELDPSSSRKSYEYFAELVKKFPDSRYVSDAIQRMDQLRNMLARHEIVVAKYYLQRNAYVAAVNRAKYVIENFPTSPSTREALEIMVQGYTKLELDQLANDARRVLALNTPAKAKSKGPKPNPDTEE